MKSNSIISIIIIFMAFSTFAFASGSIENTQNDVPAAEAEQQNETEKTSEQPKKAKPSLFVLK